MNKLVVFVTKLFDLIHVSSIWAISGGLLLLWSPAVFARQVTLEWDANTESNLGGYRLYYGPASRQYTAAVDVGNQTRYTLFDLDDAADPTGGPTTPGYSGRATRSFARRTSTVPPRTRSIPATGAADQR